MENLVSIIMPAHNSESTIIDSINSVLNQTYTNFELIIILDNCNDLTEDIVASMSIKDKRIKYFKIINNVTGAIGARNLGLEIAKGRFISFLDSDDLWTPDKLEFQINFMLDNNVPFCYANYYIFKNNQDPNSNENKLFIARAEATYKSLLKGCYIGCLTAIYDTSICGKVYMPENAIKREDFATWLTILKKGTICKNCNRALGYYRISVGSVSHKKLKMVKYQWNVYRNIEHLNSFKSFWYLLCTIINKLFFKY